MSKPIQSISTPTGEFQAPFGGSPGLADFAAECKKWESLCGELLAERAKLRAELMKSNRERDQYLKSLYQLLCKDYQLDFDKETAFAHIDDKPTIHEIIADLDRAPVH